MYFLVYDFSSFHHNNFRNTINWECIAKDVCITSCLCERVNSNKGPDSSVGGMSITWRKRFRSMSKKK